MKKTEILKKEEFLDSLVELNHSLYAKEEKSGEVYVVDYTPGDYGFEIQKITKETENAVKVEVVKNPTKEQLVNALFNYIFTENANNKYKGNTFYHLDEYNLFTKFEDFMKRIKAKEVAPKDLFEYFALDPKGEYWQGAVNGLVQNVFAKLQNKKAEKFEYVFRNRKKSSLINLHKEEDGSYIIAKPEYGTYGYELFKLKSNKIAKIEKPTANERVSALLNVILTDNFENPNKTGVYTFSKKTVEDLFDVSMKKLTVGTMMSLFGIEFDGELMNGMVLDLAKDVKDDKIGQQNNTKNDDKTL